MTKKTQDSTKKTQDSTKKNSRFNKKNSRTQNRLLGKCAAGYLLPICPDKLRVVVVRYFRENTIVLRKKTQEPRKKTQGLKKTQETQITCLGTARLVTCCQLVQTSSRMVVDRYFHPGACLDQLGASNQPRFEILEFFLDLEFFSHDS